MDINNRKFLMIVFSILLVLTVFVISLNLLNKGLYIIVSPENVFTYKNNKWESVKDKSKYNKSGYEVFVNGVSKGDYKVVYNGSEKLYEFRKRFFKKETITDNFIALRGRAKYSVEELNVENINNGDYLNIGKILKENEITYDINKLPIKGKAITDLNNDMVSEVVYYLSNTFEDTTNSKAFSIIAIVNNDKISYIHREVVPIVNMYDICMPYLHSVIDIEKDDNYEMIASCAYFSEMGTKNYIFNLIDNEYNELITNEVDA